MSKVFAVCEPFKLKEGVPTKAVDLSTASEFGNVEILLNQTQSSVATVATVRTLQDKLKDFGEDDYILPLGDPVLIATVAMVASDINGGRVKYLKWDKKTQRYYSIQVDKSGKAQ